MSEFGFTNARMEVIIALNRYSDEFPQLKDEIYYYDDILKCWTVKEKVEK